MATFAQFVAFGPFFDDGNLASGALIYHYAAGTSTLKNLWSDRDQMTTVAQPLVCDSDGLASAFGDGLYKIIVKNSAGTTLYTFDNWAITDQSTNLLGEGDAISSASTLVLGVDGNIFHITGSVTITAVSGLQNEVRLIFDESLQLTHSGNLLLPGSVNLTVQANDVLTLINEGAGVWRVVGQMPNSFLINRTDVAVVVSDARTATVDAPLTITSTTSGTPAANIGTGLLFRAESEDENPSDFGQLAFAASDISTGSEDTYCSISTRQAGAALAEAYRFGSTGGNRAAFNHGNSASRTYTLPNFDGTMATLAGVEALTNKTITVPDAAPAVPTVNVIYKDSLVKGFVVFQVNGTIDTDLNVSSITDNGVGDWTINWASNFATANYAVSLGLQAVVGASGTADGQFRIDHANDPTTTALRVVYAFDNGAGEVKADPTGTRVRMYVTAHGLQ